MFNIDHLCAYDRIREMFYEVYEIDSIIQKISNFKIIYFNWWEHIRIYYRSTN